MQDISSHWLESTMINKLPSTCYELTKHKNLMNDNSTAISITYACELEYTKMKSFF